LIAESRTTDYDLHGIAGVRLIDPSPGDVATVTRELGPMQRPLEREPDITIRFVDRIVTDAEMRHIGLNDVAFTDDSFFVLERGPKGSAKVQIPFSEIGKKCEIVCESGAYGLSLLIPILNLTMVGKDVLPLHASGFIYNGIGVLVAGWARSGKSTVLLAFMAAGADYISDDWVYVGTDGRKMYGTSAPITVRRAHLDALPQYRAAVPRRDRLRLQARGVFGRAERLTRRLARKGRPTLADALARLAEHKPFVEVSPLELFGPSSCPLEGDVEKIVLSISHELPRFTLEHVDSDDIARRLAFSLRHERLNLFSYYLKSRFVFPDAMNALLEEIDEVEAKALAQVLKDKETYLLRHPAPAPIPLAFKALAPALR
jgi:hypothetical protein